MTWAIVAGIGAVFALLLWRHFQSDDRPEGSDTTLDSQRRQDGSNGGHVTDDGGGSDGGNGGGGDGGGE